MGSIALSLSSDREVVVDTKAGAVDCSGFLVDIYGETFLGQAYASEQYVYSQMPDKVDIPYGYYFVKAQSCLEQTAAQGLGCVRYEGVSGRTDVLSQTPQQVTVTCQMVNAKVTMTFDESFLEDFSDVTVDIKATRTVNLTTAQVLASSDVYFNLPAEGTELIYTIYGTVAKGTDSEKRLSYTNAASPTKLYPAKWAKITIRSNHNGLIGPGINVDGEMGGESYTEQIDPNEENEAQDGTMPSPSIYVDTQIDDATVVDCIIDMY